jgi:hypothetical protein
LGAFFPLFFLVLVLELFLYFFILFFAALRKRMLGLPIAIATMHISWGSGLLWSTLTSFRVNNG